MSSPLDPTAENKNRLKTTFFPLIGLETQSFFELTRNYSLSSSN